MIVEGHRIEDKTRLDLTPDEMLKLIFDYAGKIANEKKVDNLIILMADMGRELVVSDRCTLWLLDKEHDELYTKFAHGVEGLRIPCCTGLVGHSISTGNEIFIDDAANDPRFNKEVDKQTGYITKSILVIPIRNSEGEIFGAFQVLNKLTESGKFSDKDMERLNLTASYSGKSLEAAMLNEEIEATQREVVFLMGEIGESRSKETGNHVKRVAEYSKLIALRLGMSEEESELIRTASPMHDIGKVAILDEILKKPGKLTEEEFAAMQKHTDIGHNLLKGSNRIILKTASIVSYQHHEKWNGRGYPQGLKGEEIHIYGRITSVADVFDALGSDRVYKKAWDLERILNLFKEERGEQFCPTVTDAFLSIVGDIVKIRDTFTD